MARDPIKQRQIAGEGVARAYGAGGYETDAADGGNKPIKPPSGLFNLGQAVHNTFRKISGNPDTSAIDEKIKQKQAINKGYRTLKGMYGK